MKKSILIVGFLVILVGFMLLANTNVYAADTSDDGISNFWTSDEEPSSTPVKQATPTSTDENKTSTKNNVSTKTNNTNNTNNTNSTKNNSVSSYNTTNNTPNSLSKAGLEDSFPTIVLVVIFAISAIYAYKKINDYKNV